MSPFEILFLSLLAVVVTAFIAILFSPRPRKQNEPMIDYDDSLTKRLNRREHDRRNVAMMQARDAAHKYVNSPRRFGTRLETPRVPAIILSARQVERINIQRRLRGRACFNPVGLSNAIAHPWNRDVRQPQNDTNWIAYLIAYEILAAGHQSPMVSSCGAVVIDPNEPYNGHGGEFAGAGASGSWETGTVGAAAAAINYSIPIVGEPGPRAADRWDTPDGMSPTARQDTGQPWLSDPNSYKGGDREDGQTYSAPDPSPSPRVDPVPSSYNAPDPSPSCSVSDSSSSYSSDSGSSSCDSGGGGGGGGGD